MKKALVTGASGFIGTKLRGRTRRSAGGAVVMTLRGGPRRPIPFALPVAERRDYFLQIPVAERRDYSGHDAGPCSRRSAARPAETVDTRNSP